MVKSIQTDGQTDRQKATHMSPPCKVHRWAKKKRRILDLITLVVDLIVIDLIDFGLDLRI